jgi:lysyl-tRNA synthetase class 2
MPRSVASRSRGSDGGDGSPGGWAAKVPRFLVLATLAAIAGRRQRSPAPALVASAFSSRAIGPPRPIAAAAGGFPKAPAHARRRRSARLSTAAQDVAAIVSPFDSSDPGGAAVSAPSSPGGLAGDGGPLDLTWDNVERVLDEMRPYLIQDGGNVKIADIDGPVVRLQLEGACGTCPSSTQTMKMGLERGLKERIPEIQEVIQAMPEGPPLDEEQVDVILDGVRPFLNVAGGTIRLDRFEGLDGLQPTIWLKMEGASATLNSVKLEIASRLQRHFMVAGLRVEWKD